MSKQRFARGWIFYYLFKAIENLGISLKLIYRRVADILVKDIGFLMKKVQEYGFNYSNITNFIESYAKFAKQMGVVKNVNLKIEDAGDAYEVTCEVTGCDFLEMARLAAEKGEKTCPLCLISLASAFVQTVLGNVTVGSIEHETDLNNEKCILKIAYIKKQ
ncbi:MAG: hypothetical protein ACTSXJ_04180 [Candidatus Baldrarchaeia archaeon]